MNRIAVIGIIVEEPQEVEKLNQLLHEWGFPTGRERSM